MVSSAKDIFNTTKTKRIFSPRQASKHNSPSNQRQHICKEKSAKNTFTLALIAEKSFSERPGRHATQNYFQNDKHQKMIQNDKRQGHF